MIWGSTPRACYSIPHPRYRVCAHGPSLPHKEGKTWKTSATKWFANMPLRALGETSIRDSLCPSKWVRNTGTNAFHVSVEQNTDGSERVQSSEYTTGPANMRNRKTTHTSWCTRWKLNGMITQCRAYTPTPWNTTFDRNRTARRENNLKGTSDNLGLRTRMHNFGPWNIKHTCECMISGHWVRLCTRMYIFVTSGHGRPIVSRGIAARCAWGAKLITWQSERFWSAAQGAFGSAFEEAYVQAVSPPKSKASHPQGRATIKRCPIAKQLFCSLSNTHQRGSERAYGLFLTFIPANSTYRINPYPLSDGMEPVVFFRS